MGAEVMPVATGLLVIDMQNGFLHPNGSGAKVSSGLVGVAEVIRQSIALIAEARKMGLPIVYTRHQYRRDHIDATRFMCELFASSPDFLIAGSWDAAILDELAPLDDEVVVEKNRYDAFLYTDLEVVLRGLDVRELVIAGVVTNACVEATARSADQRDLVVRIARDCVTSDAEGHELGLKAMERLGLSLAPWREHLRSLVVG